MKLINDIKELGASSINKDLYLFHTCTNQDFEKYIITNFSDGSSDRSSDVYFSYGKYVYIPYRFRNHESIENNKENDSPVTFIIKSNRVISNYAKEFRPYDSGFFDKQNYLDANFSKDIANEIKTELETTRGLLGCEDELVNVLKSTINCEKIKEQGEVSNHLNLLIEVFFSSQDNYKKGILECSDKIVEKHRSTKLLKLLYLLIEKDKEKHDPNKIPFCIKTALTFEIIFNIDIFKNIENTDVIKIVAANPSKMKNVQDYIKKMESPLFLFDAESNSNMDISNTWVQHFKVVDNYVKNSRN